ncbi:universal stress protein [Bartonella sp. B35(2025)]
MISRKENMKADQKGKVLVIIDETPECLRAVAFAAQHAKNTNKTLILLSVVDNSEFQHFLGVTDIMRTESTQQAYKVLEQIANNVRAIQTFEIETIVREGKKIDEDKKIALIVLAASGHTEGPGPLVKLIANRGTAFSIPVTVIPSNLADEYIESGA